MLAFLGLSDRGDELFELIGVGAFLIALSLSLVPMPLRARAAIIAVGAIGAYAFAFAYGEYGLDRLAWLIIMTAGVIGWFLGFLPAALFRTRQRLANPPG
jgi:uncharacterized membrane protein YfcA